MEQYYWLAKSVVYALRPFKTVNRTRTLHTSDLPSSTTLYSELSFGKNCLCVHAWLPEIAEEAGSQVRPSEPAAGPTGRQSSMHLGLVGTSTQHRSVRISCCCVLAACVAPAVDAVPPSTVQVVPPSPPLGSNRTCRPRPLLRPFRTINRTLHTSDLRGSTFTFQSLQYGERAPHFAPPLPDGRCRECHSPSSSRKWMVIGRPWKITEAPRGSEGSVELEAQ